MPRSQAHIGRDVHCSTVANNETGLFSTFLSHAEELVFQSQLNLERSLLTFVKESLVCGQVVHARLCEERSYFRYCKYFEPKT